MTEGPGRALAFRGGSIARRAAERAEAGEAEGEAAGSGEAQVGSGAAGARRVRSRR